MKNSFVVLLLLIIGISCSQSIQPPSYFAKWLSSHECTCTSESQSEIDSAINNCVEYIEELRNKTLIPGLVVGISRKGRPVWVKAFGESDLENGVKTREDSVWRLASISKSLTSVLIGHLLEKKLISLEDSIDRYLNEDIFPIKKWNNTKVSITLSQLMSHTAGLRVSQYPEDFDKILYFRNATETVSQFKDWPLISSPGTQFNYSNYGFQVLGAVIESVLKMPYQTAIDQMFVEMGLKSTFCERQNRLIPRRARYYIRSDSILLKKSNNTSLKVMPALIVDDIWSQNSWHTSAGVMSDTNDLLRFGNYLIDSFKGNTTTDYGLPLLNSSTVKTLWEPVITDCDHCDQLKGITNYCHGWFQLVPDQPITCEGNCQMSPITSVYLHSGGLSGLSTMLLVMPEQDLVVTVLSNTNPFNEILDLSLFVAKSFIL